jgi:hypothetical protein
MDIREIWEKAIAKTEIVRFQVKGLLTFSATELSYIFLAESALNIGDTVVRKGKIIVEKPMILLPGGLPTFSGFDFEHGLNISEDSLTNFLLVRGVRFPSLKYNNETSSLDIFEGSLKQAIKHYANILEKKEDVSTGLILGPEDSWQFSLLIFIAATVSRSADGDIRRILEDFRKKGDF